MFGLDDKIASVGTGDAFLLIIAVAVLLGLRHATDPDHLTAVSTLIAAERDNHTRRAGMLGFAWGMGHATTLFLFGLPIVLFNQYLPPVVLTAAEVAIGIVIVALALRLVLRWRKGYFHAHVHGHDDATTHRHLHSHSDGGEHDHVHDPAQQIGRSPLQAYGIGLVHGVGGSAGVGVLLLAAIHDRATGVAALLVFALFTAVSMALVSTTFGYAITRGPVMRRFVQLAPVLGVASMLFGLWYMLGALNAVPYVF